MNSSADDDDDDDDVNELLLLSDVDPSLQSLSLKHHLDMKSVRLVYSISYDNRVHRNYQIIKTFQAEVIITPCLLMF